MTVKQILKRVLLGAEQQALPELGRNERCWCGSGKKYKACHMATDDRKRSSARATAAAQSNPALRGF